MFVSNDEPQDFSIPLKFCPKCHRQLVLIECTACNNGIKICYKCSGTGKVEEKILWLIPYQKKCNACSGNKYFICRECFGTGLVCSNCQYSVSNVRGQQGKDEGMLTGGY